MQNKNYGIFVLLLGIILVAGIANPLFVGADNLSTLIRDTSLYGLISIGVAVVIVTGGIDLSIGSLIAFSGVVFGLLLNPHEVTVQQSGKVAAVQRVNVSDLAPAQLPDMFKSQNQDSATLPSRRLALVRLTEMPDSVQPNLKIRFQLFGGAREIDVAGLAEYQEQRWFVCNTKLQGLSADKSVNYGETRWVSNNPWLVAALVVAMSALLGALHGFLIAYMRLQAFVVTLVGLLVYRGLARGIAGDTSVGLLQAARGFRYDLGGSVIEIPMGNSVFAISNPALLTLLVTISVWFFINRTIWGRHLLATGQNETAARYSGISTRPLILSTYVFSSTLAGLSGILFAVEWNSIQPSNSGNFYELYAIAAAVLGGCSLRGGAAATFGVIAGAAVMRCLYKMIPLLGINNRWELVIIGGALMVAVVVDETYRRWKLAKG